MASPDLYLPSVLTPLLIGRKGSLLGTYLNEGFNQDLTHKLAFGTGKVSWPLWPL